MSELTITRTVADVTRDIRIKTGQFLMDAIDIGRLLFEAKAMVPAGQWSKYIEEELPFSHVRMVACMNALEQLIQDAANPMPEQPITPTKPEEKPECQEDIAGKENTVYGKQTD